MIDNEVKMALALVLSGFWIAYYLFQRFGRMMSAMLRRGSGKVGSESSPSSNSRARKAHT
jgi:hypothetical protein